MFGRLRMLAVGIGAAGILGACGLPAAPIALDSQQPQPLIGGALTFSIGNQRFALAAFVPPASMILVQTGPFFFWITPSAAMRDVYLQEVVADQAVGSPVLEVNGTGRIDYTYELRWSR